MKKFLSFIIIFSIIVCCSASAKSNEITVVIPEYQIIVDNSSIYYNDSLYPFINYKGITYLPMTYEYSRAMNLTTSWLTGSAFMVAYQPSYNMLPIYETTANNKYNKAVIPHGYRIYVNGKEFDNENAKYPLLNFRGVTYFPMTWDLVVNEFGWELIFENNVLNITTEANKKNIWDIEEKNKDYAILSHYHEIEIPDSSGSYKYEYTTEYYKLDYKTGKTTIIPDYVSSATGQPLPTNIPIELTVKNGYVYYKDQQLENLYIEQESDSYNKPDDIEKSEYSLSGWIYGSIEHLNVAYINLNTTNYYKNTSMSGSKTEYTFILHNDTLTYLGSFRTVENVYTIGNDIYFNTVDYAQTIFRHYHNNRKLWKFGEDGNLNEIKYDDYNSMKIIGKADNKLYLKCLWAPDNYIDDSPYEVSLINDGYYTFDGDSIRFIAPYIYSDIDILSDNGDIIAINNKLNKITKVEAYSKYH